MRLSRRAVFAVVVGVLATLVGGAVSGSALAAAPPQLRSGAPGGTYVPLPPARVLDTRIHQGGSEPAAQGTVALHVTGVGGVPSSGVSAVVLNVTVAAPSAGGYVTVYPAGTSRPTASNVNFAAGRTVANLVLAKVGTNGVVELYNGSRGKNELVADVSGYYTAGTPDAAGAFQPLAPARILDTRIERGGSAPAGHGQVVLQVGGAGNVPSSVGAIALNVTAAGATANGPITVYPDDGEVPPVASNLNVVAATTLADMVVVSVPANGKIVLYNGSSRTVQLIADVAGYFLPGQAHLPATLSATSPARVLDTRVDDLNPEPAPGGAVALKAAGHLTLPPTGVAAVILTVTITAPQRGGYVTVYADGTSRPTASNVNFRAGQTVANLVVAPISASGVIDFYNGSPGKTQIVADIEGYYSSLPNNWTASLPSMPTGQNSQGITGVSCPTSASCTAVGIWQKQSPYTVGPLIETLSGGAWTAVRQNPPSTNIERKLTAVSCAAVGACTAVGFDSHDDSTGDNPGVLPVVDTVVNGVWTATELPAPPAAPGDLQAAELDAVSCTSPTACVAVGYYFPGSASSQMLVETLSGTTWTATEVALPAEHSGYLQSVSCTSNTTCVAVGGVAPVATRSWSAAIETLSGGQWTLDTTLDVAAAGTAQGWSGVSCPAAGACVAVSNNGIAATLSNGSWAAGTTPRGMNAVSCSSVVACTAVGAYDSDRAGDSQPWVAELQGTTWTPFGLPRPVGFGQLLAVSCPGDMSCVAGGNAVIYGVTAVTTPPLLESDLSP